MKRKEAIVGTWDRHSSNRRSIKVLVLPGPDANAVFGHRTTDFQASHQANKMPAHSCQPVFEYVDANSASLIQRLKEAVAIPSVSGDAKYRPDVFKMADWLDAQLQALGVK